MDTPPLERGRIDKKGTRQVVQNTTVQDPVNTTAVDFLNRAEGKIQVAHWYLTAQTDRDLPGALGWIDQAITDLESAKAAITTGEARELRRPVDVSPAHEVVDL